MCVCWQEAALAEASKSAYVAVEELRRSLDHVEKAVLQQSCVVGHISSCDSSPLSLKTADGRPPRPPSGGFRGAAARLYHSWDASAGDNGAGAKKEEKEEKKKERLEWGQCEWPSTLALISSSRKGGSKGEPTVGFEHATAVDTSADLKETIRYLSSRQKKEASKPPSEQEQGWEGEGESGPPKAGLQVLFDAAQSSRDPPPPDFGAKAKGRRFRWRFFLAGVVALPVIVGLVSQGVVPLIATGAAQKSQRRKWRRRVQATIESPVPQQIETFVAGENRRGGQTCQARHGAATSLSYLSAFQRLASEAASAGMKSIGSLLSRFSFDGWPLRARPAQYVLSTLPIRLSHMSRASLSFDE